MEAFAAILLAITKAPVTLAQQLTPSPKLILYDAKHKEPKSGVELHGNQLTIRSGVGTPSTINVLAFSGDGRFLAAGKDFGRVVVWNVADRSYVCALDTGQSIVHAVAISADGQLLATSGSNIDPDIKIWHLPDGKLLNDFRIGHPAVQKLLFAQDASSLVVAESNAVMYVLDVKAGTHQQEFIGEWAPVFSTDGKTIMTISNTEVILRNTTDWQRQKSFPKPTKYAIPFSLDTALDLYLFGDSTDENSFAAVRLSTGELLPNLRKAKLPELTSVQVFLPRLIPARALYSVTVKADCGPGIFRLAKPAPRRCYTVKAAR
ncbi:MAG: WD40 repeat domain-containing protein [Candidatus Acidiferrum sp.]